MSSTHITPLQSPEVPELSRPNSVFQCSGALPSATLTYADTNLPPMDLDGFDAGASLHPGYHTSAYPLHAPFSTNSTDHLGNFKAPYVTQFTHFKLRPDLNSAPPAGQRPTEMAYSASFPADDLLGMSELPQSPIEFTSVNGKTHLRLEISQAQCFDGAGSTVSHQSPTTTATGGLEPGTLLATAVRPKFGEIVQRALVDQLLQFTIPLIASVLHGKGATCECSEDDLLEYENEYRRMLAALSIRFSMKTRERVQIRRKRAEHLAHSLKSGLVELGETDFLAHQHFDGRLIDGALIRGSRCIRNSMAATGDTTMASAGSWFRDSVMMPILDYDQGSSLSTSQRQSSSTATTRSENQVTSDVRAEMTHLPQSPNADGAASLGKDSNAAFLPTKDCDHAPPIAPRSPQLLRQGESTSVVNVPGSANKPYPQRTNSQQPSQAGLYDMNRHVIDGQLKLPSHKKASKRQGSPAKKRRRVGGQRTDDCSVSVSGRTTPIIVDDDGQATDDDATFVPRV